MLTRTERQALLRLARLALTARVTGALDPALPDVASLHRPAGAFVTLTARSELRGCIGHPEADQALAGVVSRCAAAAATEDPRFDPVTPAELAGILVEVSVLGALERVHDPSTIVVGRHGLIVEQGVRRGLLLPQVATEWRWDWQTFVSQTCRKAGLRPDAWRTGASILSFEAEVFGEGEREV